ncbi:MAG: hypothetical protein HY055_11025 [Magnetospirillum sp.]|nr:hypothetical protein [Magnetospirillum sp.]
MARKKPTDNTYVLFDVIYQDGAVRSNRKIPSAELMGPEGFDIAQSLIEEQDRKIDEMSGNPRGPIKSIARSPGQ